MPPARARSLPEREKVASRIPAVFQPDSSLGKRSLFRCLPAFAEIRAFRPIPPQIAAPGQGQGPLEETRIGRGRVQPGERQPWMSMARSGPITVRRSALRSMAAPPPRIAARAETVLPCVRAFVGPIRRPLWPGSITTTLACRCGVTGESDAGDKLRSAGPGVERTGDGGHAGLFGCAGPRGARRLDPRPAAGRVAWRQLYLQPRLAGHADILADPEDEVEGRHHRLAGPHGREHHRQDQFPGIADGLHPVVLEDDRPRPFVAHRGEVRRTRPVEHRRHPRLSRHPPVGVPARGQADLHGRDMAAVGGLPALDQTHLGWRRRQSGQ